MTVLLPGFLDAHVHLALIDPAVLAAGSAQGSSGVSGVVGRAACDIRHPGISVRTA